MNRRNDLNFILGLLTMVLAFLMIVGIPQQYVTFAHEWNEMVFTFLCCILSAAFFLMIERKK
jgi:hypothetical protein